MIESLTKSQQFIVKIFISLLLIAPFVGSDLYTKHLAHQYLAEDNGVIQSVEINQYLLAESPIRNNQPWYYPEINQTVYKLIFFFFFSLILLGLFFHVEDILDINRSVRHEGWGGLSWAAPIAGGCAGNIIELLFFGGATDFLILPDGNWIFNLADIYITLGLALILISELFLKKFDKDTYIFWGSYLAVIFTLVSVNSHAEVADKSSRESCFYFTTVTETVVSDCENKAEQGDSTAQFNLGWIYLNGKGIPKDDKQASRWFKKSAEQGHSEAQYILGRMYHSGQGVVKDNKESVKWFRKSAEQGHPKAQNNLGLAYDLGEGIPKDDEEAIRWFSEAAAQGDPKGQINLGIICADENGIVADFVLAYAWFDVALKNKNNSHLKETREMRDNVSAQMSPYQIKKAQELSSKW